MSGINLMLTEARQDAPHRETSPRRAEVMAKIVVVEDEADLREILVEELADMGHEIAIACDGEEGLAVILEHTPDLILADINMPKLNGRELRLALVSDHPDHATIPFGFCGQAGCQGGPEHGSYPLFHQADRLWRA